MKYLNPVIPGFHPDPSICRVGEDYYLVTSSFEYFPGVPVFQSRDLVHWRQLGNCLTRPSQLPLDKAPSSAGIYAPTIRFHDGTFYMVTTNVSGGGHFYVHTQDPAREWSEPIWVQADTHLQGSIDPSLFFEDNKVYFSCTGSGQRILQFEINIQTGKAVTEPRAIWSGTGGKYPEGPHLYKINGLYYLMSAEGGTEYAHMETIIRAQTPYGPFTPCPHNPILTHRGLDTPIQATGHADLIQAHDGSWWMVFLAVRPNGYPPCYHLGRETFLAPVRWTDDGWPVVGENGQVTLEMDADLLPEYTWPHESGRDDFTGSRLGPNWNFRRNPAPDTWSLAMRPGWLCLTGNRTTLDDLDAPAFIGRRQEHFECLVTALLDYQPAYDGEEAGLTVLMNEGHHYEIAVRRSGAPGSARQIFVRRRIGSLVAEVAQAEIGNGTVLLRIEANRDWYTFSYTAANEDFKMIAAGETRYLSTEVAGGFTGVYFGMYAQTNDNNRRTPAYFDWFEYVPQQN